MSVKDDDAALLTQGKEEDADRRKIDRKDGLVFKLSDYTTRRRKTGIIRMATAPTTTIQAKISAAT